MEKEFIPYEQALSLKELGFNEPCFGYRDGGGYLMIKSTPHCTISAPTFSQAFRWFREKHNLHHEIEYNGYEYLGYVSGMTANIFKTHEEAELACLQKLIEIAKARG